MARSASSSRWLREHREDPYVRGARQLGLRSRAAYKLLEIERRDHLFRGVRCAVDLGAAPGAWSQVAAQAVGTRGIVVACDIDPMEPIDNVRFIQGDFRDQDVYAAVLEAAGTASVDLVLSDLAPNLSGMRAIDQPRAMHLVELACEFAREVLRPGGTLLVKVFQGEGVDRLLHDMRGEYRSLKVRKPQASRARSRETYVLAQGYGV